MAEVSLLAAYPLACCCQMGDLKVGSDVARVVQTTDVS
jgi:hypothetical protein